MISLICVKHVKHDTNEPICESETDSQTQKTDLQLPRSGRGRDGVGVWD